MFEGENAFLFLNFQDSYQNLIEDYQRDLDESIKTLTTLKPVMFTRARVSSNFIFMIFFVCFEILKPDQLRTSQIGKTDVSWLSWRRNTLGSKLHKEMNDLHELVVDEEHASGSTSPTTTAAMLQTRLKSVDEILQTANTLHESAQYLSWFTRRVVEYNDSLPEFERVIPRSQ